MHSYLKWYAKNVWFLIVLHILREEKFLQLKTRIHVTVHSRLVTTMPCSMRFLCILNSSGMLKTEGTNWRLVSKSTAHIRWGKIASQANLNAKNLPNTFFSQSFTFLKIFFDIVWEDCIWKHYQIILQGLKKREITLILNLDLPFSSFRVKGWTNNHLRGCILEELLFLFFECNSSCSERSKLVIVYDISPQPITYLSNSRKPRIVIICQMLM